MTGTGTQADPYVVDNWADFQSVVNISGAYVKFDDTATTKIIDMDDIAPEGVTSMATISCVQIDGNGWEIRNLKANWSSSQGFFNIKSTTINDLSLTAMQISNSSGGCFFTSNNVVTLNNCKISGRFTSSNSSVTGVFEMSGSSSPRFNLNRCSITFDIIGSYVQFSHASRSSSSYGKLSINYCNINLRTLSYVSSRDFFSNVAATGSIIRGDYNFKYEGTTNFIYTLATSDLLIDSNITSSSNTTVNFEVNSATSFVLVNSDKITATITPTTTTGVYMCTTTQLVDTDYLNTIHFPIGV